MRGHISLLAKQGNEKQVNDMTVFTEEVGKYLEADPPSCFATTAGHVLSVSTFNVLHSTFHVSSDGKWNYIWNGENRIITMSNATTVLTFAYDHQGRRFRKVVDDGSTVTTNTFLYDGWNLVQEVRSQNSEVSTNLYTWGIDLSGSLQGAGGIGGLLAVSQSGAGVPPAVFSPAFDGNGNITDYVSTNGTVVAHYEYGPFGETIAATGEMKDAFPFRFSSKYEDAETGFLYYGYRFFSPELGRWLNRDPLHDEAFLTQYADNKFRRISPVTRWRKTQELRKETVKSPYNFVDNAPIAKVDLLGLACTASDTEIESVAYDASIDAWDDTSDDSPFNREYCGLICCKDNEVKKKNHHVGDCKSCIPTYQPATRTTAAQYVSCPSGWKLVAGYHSHPKGSTSFSDADKSWAKNKGVSLYLGVDGTVSMVDKDGNETYSITRP